MATRIPLYLDFLNGEVKEFARNDALDFNSVSGIVPSGGSANQVLRKTTDADYNYEWATVSGGGDLLSTNNLSDVANAETARTNLGLGNVDNTSDADKPVSTEQQAALDLKQNLDTQLTDLAGLAYAGNSLKVVRVNSGETAFELATPGNDIALSLIAPSVDETITAGYSAYVSGYYEIADTKTLEIGSGSVFEIG